MRVGKHLDDGILCVEITNPPVNSLTRAVRQSLYQALTLDAKNPHVSAIVLSGRGRCFCAGGDLREMGTDAAGAEPRLSAHILPAIERCPKPVIAAVHGAAIGGGFEMALACHYRLALTSTVLALPEVTHGIIPLSGAIRLPRLWGIDKTLAMILSSSRVRAPDFGNSVFDQLIPCEASESAAQHASVVHAALRFARAHVICVAGIESHRARLVRHRGFREDEPRQAFARAVKQHGTDAMTLAQRGVIAAMRAAIESDDVDAALSESQRIYDELAAARP